MEWSLFVNRMLKKAPNLPRWLILTLGLAVIGVSVAQAAPVSQQDREEIARLRAIQGGSVEEVNPLIEQANSAAARGLPEDPLVNKIK